MRQRSMIIKLVCLFLLPVTIILQRIFSYFPETIEKLYSNSLYKQISIPISSVIERIPFSVSCVINYSFVVLVILYVVLIIHKLILEKERRFLLLKNSLLNSFALTGVLYFLFMIGWGFNYVRVPFADTIGLTLEDNYSTDDLYRMCEYLIENNERLQLEFDIYNNNNSESKESVISSILERSDKGYEILSDKYLVFKGEYSRPKRVLLNSINNISGFYSPFLFEANVNTSVPLSLLPFIACHEKAHQYGYAGEDEASLIAYISCSNHTDIDYIYSGNLFAVHQSLSSIRSANSEVYEQMIEKCNKKLIGDLTEIDNFETNQKKTAVSYINGKIYDLFLKSNMQKEGMKSYSGVVKLLLSLYKINQL